MTMSKTFKLTERVNLKFDANAFNVFNRANFILATAGGGANNKYATLAFDPNVGAKERSAARFQFRSGRRNAQSS